jgi:phage gpG-like protein
MMYFAITSTADRVVREVNGLALGLRTSTRDLLESAVREVAIPSIERNFQAGGRPEWDELASSTVERKGHDRPLFLSGRGQDAATDPRRWSINRREAAYRGDSFPAVTEGGYIALHQHGRDEHDVSFPARPFVQLQPEDERALDRVGLTWLDGNLRRAGF